MCNGRQDSAEAVPPHDPQSACGDLRVLADLVSDIIIRIDRQWRFLYVNRRFEESGWRPEEVIGKTVSEVGIPCERYRRWFDAVEQAFQTAARQDFEMTGVRPDGMHHFEVQIVPETDPNGSVSTVLSVSRDVTDRYCVQQALKQGELQYRSLVEHLSDAVVIHRGGPLVFVNDAGIKLFGAARREDVLGRCWQEFIHPDYHDQARERQRQVIDGRQPVPLVHLQLIRLDGKLIDVEAGGIPCVFDGMAAAQFIVRDVSDHRRAEEKARKRLADTAHLLRVNTMGQLVAELAHELNEPLYAISNFATACTNTLRAAGAQDMPAHAQLLAWLEQIAEQVKRGSEILHSTSSFIRKDSGQRSHANLAQLIRDCLRLLQVDVRMARVRLRQEIAEPAPIIRVDCLQIEQVFVNLIRNAVEALESVPPEEREIVVGAQLTQQNQVEVTVSDTGCGVQGRGERLFRPFFTTKPNGMGMGLPISASIIEAHGGRMWVTPGKVRGAVFHFTLPIVNGTSNYEQCYS